MVFDGEDHIKLGLASLSKLVETVRRLAIFVWERLQ